MNGFELARLAELAALVKVAHHIPGRARLKLGGNPPEWLLNGGVENLRSIKGVRSVSLNPLSASAVINYDEGEIPPAIFESMAAGDSEPFLDFARRL